MLKFIEMYPPQKKFYSMIILKIQCFKLKKVTLHAFQGEAAAPWEDISSDPDGCQDWDLGSHGTFRAEHKPSEGAEVGMGWPCQVARNATGGTGEMSWEIQLLVHRV